MGISDLLLVDGVGIRDLLFVVGVGIKDLVTACSWDEY